MYGSALRKKRIVKTKIYLQRRTSTGINSAVGRVSRKCIAGTECVTHRGEQVMESAIQMETPPLLSYTTGNDKSLAVLGPVFIIAGSSARYGGHTEVIISWHLSGGQSAGNHEHTHAQVAANTAQYCSTLRYRCRGKSSS